MESPNSSTIKDTADAVKGIVEAVPVYQDVVQPAAQEVGKALQVVAKTIHIALAPVSVLVWGYDKIKDFVSQKVAEKLEGIPEEDIVSPKPHIAVPLLEALRYTGSEEELNNMYANLLASSMDIKTIETAHPGFVEIIKQLTPDEAKLIKYFSNNSTLPLITLRLETGMPNQGGFDTIKKLSYFGEDAGCQNPELVPTYLDNLSRLGLIKIPENYWYTDPNIYKRIENHPKAVAFKQGIDMQKASLEYLKREPSIPSTVIDSISNQSVKIKREQVQITDLGIMFTKACVKEHRKSKA